MTNPKQSKEKKGREDPSKTEGKGGSSTSSATETQDEETSVKLAMCRYAGQSRRNGQMADTCSLLKLGTIMLRNIDKDIPKNSSQLTHA